jgi:hypothetical protein
MYFKLRKYFVYEIEVKMPCPSSTSSPEYRTKDGIGESHPESKSVVEF